LNVGCHNPLAPGAWNVLHLLMSGPHHLPGGGSVRHDQAPAVPSALFTGSLDLIYVPEEPPSQKFDPAD